MISLAPLLYRMPKVLHNPSFFEFFVTESPAVDIFPAVWYNESDWLGYLFHHDETPKIAFVSLRDRVSRKTRRNAL